MAALFGELRRSLRWVASAGITWQHDRSSPIAGLVTGDVHDKFALQHGRVVVFRVQKTSVGWRSGVGADWGRDWGSR